MSGDAHLVVVDMQRVFADADSAWATPGYASASAGVRRLLPAFGGRTVFTRFVAPAQPEGAWAPYYRDWPDQLRPADDPIWDLTPEFAGGDAPVVTATTFGKWGPDLAAATSGTDRLIVAGVSTDCCVLSTALAAADAGGSSSCQPTRARGSRRRTMGGRWTRWRCTRRSSRSAASTPC